ncbi:MAG: 3-oxoacyl-[acyl-carrier-protein] reductase [Caldicoprobacterales bacterium]|jgi:3-oxoacyl-[acyl-carrier protein] reductase|nr:3-oxoacyl-[acyl-carrier-protein] reductase [Clostridia bacterium]MDI9512038.1 3-oxoacyl-[acyl-carrier-protein] reductase [Bacillota bacterium]NLH58834.1 3-oxoacyl-[acyl-carrier-protein] reductase [Clostridiales bacterium]
MSLKGKTAIITGGSRGIGKACAIYLAKQGADIVFNYSNNSSMAEETADEIKNLGVKVQAVKADVKSSQDIDYLFNQALENFNSIDILVNNAGITRDTLLIRMKEEDWDTVLDINLKGVYLTCKAAAKHMMKKRQGRIINISSVVGITGNPGQANYAASKAGIIGFSKSIAKELAPRGILVNVVAPGFIDTDMTSVLGEKVKDNILSQIPLGRYGSPEDVAKLVTFLASDDNQYITGQVINIDGGMLM